MFVYNKKTKIWKNNEKLYESILSVKYVGIFQKKSLFESKVCHNICYIHKIAFVPIEEEEPIPFAGVIKFLEYKCPMCESRPQDIRHYETE